MGIFSENPEIPSTEGFSHRGWAPHTGPLRRQARYWGKGGKGRLTGEVTEYKEMWPQFGTLSYYLGGQGQKDEEAQGFGVGCLEDAFEFSGPASMPG